ncbi:MAG: 2-oxoglutarate oxidoreductase [Candidatus Sericytochromatia bacterium]|nr:2-oxoglutarate oxidoreductase [Candidatus Tanganyikabacteria bacterium]
MTTLQACSLLGCPIDDRFLAADDYAGPLARWCPGCGDHAILASVRRLCENHQLQPEQTVFVSGIGCSSRFPHYMKTYGFHGLHGRALPLALGVKLRRPDLTVFVSTGDGDCFSIGSAHWLHTVRYNPDMVVMVFDNNVYGLTKNQTSPTSPQGYPSNTQPTGALLGPMNPLSVTLGISGASFVAQTCDWLPAHLDAVLEKAFAHRGLSFVRILQRCPEYTDKIFTEAMRNPDRVELLTHEDGVDLPQLARTYQHQTRHDPSDLHRARQLAESTDRYRLGIFYRNAAMPVYEQVRAVPARSAAERLATLELELDKYAV